MAAATTEPAATAAARSVLYGLLSHALAYPTAAHRSALAELRPAAAELRTDLPALDRALRAALAAMPADPAGLQPAHGRLFTVIESRDCPAHETAYRDRDVFRQAHVMADIAGCYLAHGLRVGGDERERPDHITVELEFMGFLAAKQAHAAAELGPSQVAECIRTQRLFLREHLACWAPGFGRRMALVADHDAYGALGTLLAAWIEADVSELGVEPAVRLDTPRPPPPPDDGRCGPDADRAWPIQLGRRRS